MKRAEWTPEAQQDLAHIDDYHRERDPDYADQLGRSLLSAARFAAQFPKAGEEIRRGIRKRTVPRSSYVLIYRIRRQAIEILGIHHNKTGWRPL